MSTWQAVKLSRLSLLVENVILASLPPQNFWLFWGYMKLQVSLHCIELHPGWQVLFKCAVKLSYSVVEKCLNTTVLNLTVLKIKLSVNLNSNRAFVFQVWRTWACWPSVNLFRKHSRNYNTVSHFNMHAWHTGVLEINIKEENFFICDQKMHTPWCQWLYGVSYLSIFLWVLKSFSWSDKGFSRINKVKTNKQTNKQIQKISPHKNKFHGWQDH